MKTTASTLKILACLLGILVLMACNPVEKNAKSPTMLIIESIMGTTSDGTAANYLESSVTTGKSDVATITLQASLLNPSSLTGASQYNSVTLTSYKVDYFLQDGTGTPGVTVPNSLQGTISSLTISVGSSATITIIVVLDSAKLVAPLSSLAGTTTKLPVIAKITIQGQDLTGKPVEAQGQLSIIFGDYPVTTGS
jgi:hypothetical protein